MVPEKERVAVFAFGSHASGEPRIHSDLDLIVVADGVDLPDLMTRVQVINQWFVDGRILKLDFRLGGFSEIEEHNPERIARRRAVRIEVDGLLERCVALRDLLVCEVLQALLIERARLELPHLRVCRGSTRGEQEDTDHQ
jgi:predicted nucleotidyltransferase